MPSSISVSKSVPVFYAKVLVATVAVILIALEIGANYLLKHDSPTYARISRQYEQALGARRAESGEPPAVLMVGNSLLLHGVKVDRLQAMTSSQIRVYPIFLEATGYYDWLYALRRMFREGAKPDVVVLGVGVNFFLENGIRQDYAPKLFFDGRDTFSLASDLKMDRTATSNLVLAHWSTFWDTRNAIRLQVLKHMVPHLEDLFSFINSPPPIPDGKELQAVSIPRLQRLQQLCADHGVKLILLLPPTLSSSGPIGEMAKASHMAGVEVSVPIDPAMLSAKYFQPDGMHLNSDGAILFTSALARDLPERVANGNALATASAIHRQRRTPPFAPVFVNDYTTYTSDSDF